MSVLFRLSAVLVLVLAGAIGPASPAAADTKAPTVVVSIAPLHSLAAAIMVGVGAPKLLLERRTSPHDTTLRPSQARALARADLVLWVGPELERFMVTLLQSGRPGRRVLSAMQLPGIERRRTRKHGVWTNSDGHEVEATGAASDPHIWLSTGNARTIAGALAQTLTEIDPAHAQAYRRNLADLGRELAALDSEIGKRLAPFRETPFVLLHDAFQYFEKAYGLHPVGALVRKAAGGAGARRLYELRQVIAERGVRCIAADPFGSSALARTLARAKALTLIALDPMGAATPPGPGLYPAMMRANAEALASCLRLR